MRSTLVALVVASAFVGGGVSAQDTEVIPHRQDRVPNRPRTPAEAVARMTVPPGFSVEVVAAEPQIVNPLAMAFDDRGRIWVTESTEYPRKRPGPGADRITILEDGDGDGRVDRVSVFAEGLNIPSGIALGHGGVWVLNAPDLLFFPGTDGEPSTPEVVVTGFGRTDTHELPNSLTWGPDGWLYGLNGVFNRSRVVAGGREHRFTCALFRVHPRTREFQIFCEGTSNPWGLAWDPEGSAIVSACHWAKDHVFHFVETGIYQRQAGAYPPHAWRLGSVSDHGHQKTAYCGLAWFDSDAYPESYRERLYMGNVHGGCINVDRLARSGSTYLSTAEPDFLQANDVWFMPVAQATGPDGCLYVLDWYDRYHCYQDANRDPEGIDRERGRLYRIRYGEAPRAPRFDLARESDEALLARLASPNIFFREHAQRILSERSAPALHRRLEAMALDASVSRKGRLHALWARIGGGALEPDFHRALLAHPDPTFRAWGVRAAGNAGEVDAPVLERLAALAFDGSADVQLQVAIAARKVTGADALALLLNVLSACGEDRLLPPIVWQNLHPLLETRGADFVRLAAAVPEAGSPALARTLPRVLARLLDAAEPDFASAAAVFECLSAARGEPAREGLSVLAAKLPELAPVARERLRPQIRPSLDALLEASAEDGLSRSARLVAARLGLAELDVGATRALFLAPERASEVRLQALDSLIVNQDDRVLELVDSVLADAPPAFAAEVLAVCARLSDDRLARVVLARYADMDPEVQPLALELLLERRSWSRRLLDAVLEGDLPRDTLQANHLRKILEGNDRESIWAIEKEWGQVRLERNPEREDVVAETRAWLGDHPGDPIAGRNVFREHCSRCHVIYGRGEDVGPDLTTNGRASFEQLVANVLDPSLVVGPGYQSTAVVTTDGRVLTGLVVEDSGPRLVLKLEGGRREVLPRATVKYVRASPLSLMPEGLEQLVSRQGLADLFAFLALDSPPGDAGGDALPIPGAPAWLESWVAAPPAGAAEASGGGRGE